MDPRILRELEIAASAEAAWDALARVEDWPTWAHHIRSVTAEPPGPLGPDSAGVIRLTNGVTSRFAMTAWNPKRSWTWEGRFLWLTVIYDHVFEPLGEERARVRFDVLVSGFCSSTLGRLFAAIYERNLDRAIPNLVDQFERHRNPA